MNIVLGVQNMNSKSGSIVFVFVFFITNQAHALDWKQLGFALGCTVNRSKFSCPKSDGGRDIMWDKAWALKAANAKDLEAITKSSDAHPDVKNAAQLELQRRTRVQPFKAIEKSSVYE